MIDAIATTAARIEALTHPNAIILPHFPRSLQLDSKSCGANSVYTILRYYKKDCTPQSVEQALKTDEDGTAVSDIKRVFQRYHLNCRPLRKPGLRELKAAINNGHPVLITIYDFEHYVVFTGYSRTHVFLMNSSLDFTSNGVGGLRCAVSKSEFKNIWDRWGIVVSE
jgi:ABC-type bacteriocin/lantibiotic exporter with double-glycine peptidase domain